MNSARTVIALDTALGIWAMLIASIFFALYLWKTYIEPKDPLPSLGRRLAEAAIPSAVIGACTLFIVVAPRWAAIYFVVWWTVLFAVLPFGVRTQAEAGDVVPGSAPSAPIAPHLRQKAIATTGVAAVLTAAFWAFLTLWRG